MNVTQLTAYQLLKDRLTKNVYKRGQYKGDAPLEKRAKSHVRIVAASDRMCVQMYGTKIMTAYMDGALEIDLGGWAGSSTTKQWLNYALSVAGFRGFWLGNKSVMSLNQLTITTPSGIYLYYNGIRFNGDGTLDSKPKPFEARRIDKDASKLLMDAVKESGFKDMYPVLYATAQAEDYEGTTSTTRWRDHIQDADYAPYWPELVLWWKFDKRWYLPQTGGHKYGVVEIGTAKTCWARMMAQVKQDMYDTIRTEVTRLDV